MKIIAFGYKKGSGKDTAGKFLSTHLKITAGHLKVKQISFAAKLKDISHQLYGWAGIRPGVYYETHWERKEKVLPKLGLSPRDIWISIGNKMREVYSDVWINFALHGVDADILIISDLRFINEAKAILKADGWLAEILRDGIPKGTDPAEVELDNWTNWKYIIDNFGTFQDLHTQIEKIAEDLIENG